MTPTLIDVLHDRAHQELDRVGYRFLIDGEDIEASITYAELDRQARAIASWLQSSGAVGERVLLIYPSGLDFIAAFWGCLYAGAVAVPAYPPRQNHRLERLQAIASDAQPAFALTSSRLLTRTERWAEQCSEFRKLKWMATDQHLSNEEKWQYPAIDEGSLAFLQYTSGSTSTPRGVMMSHGNILQMEAMIEDAFKTTDRSMVVGWLPLYHDMGLIGNVLHPLFVGAECILMSPTSFLQSPYRWLRAISKYKATVSAGPDFAYRLCTRKIATDQRAMLDLSSWQVAINGAEPIQAETINEFCAYFEPCGFRREAFYLCYGLAEATLMVSGVKPAHLQSLPMDTADVSCGQPLAGESVVIADPETLTKCPANQVGEICVAGPNVARGYWRRDEETADIFHSHVSGAAKEQTYLRTGDLGYFTNGELVVKGRRKDLIIIRGVNHYPQDIELTVERSHPALQPNSGAAFSGNAGGEEQLIVVQELNSRRPSDLDSISAAICRAVAQQHELQVHAVRLIKPGSIPRTSSGKIQRYLCREQFLNETLSVLAAWDLPRTDTLETVAPSRFQSVEEIEAWLVSHLARKVGLQSYQIDSTDSALSYGLDSLSAIELTNDIESTLGVTMPMVGFLQNNSIVELAVQLFAKSTTPTVSENDPQLPQTAGTDYPLSYGQRALWFLKESAPENTAYNIATAARIHSDLDTAALRRAFQSLINRHPSLRTIFTVSKGRVVQRVQEQVEVHFVQEDASTWNDSDFNGRLAREAAIPFNLRNGPLLRVSLFKRSPGEYVVLLVVHHIVTDFWSLALIARDLSILYDSETTGRPATLAPLELSYTDYTRRQIEMLDGSEGERLWAFWEKQLSGKLPVIEFPTKRQTRTVQTYRGATVTFALDAEITERVKRLSQQHAVTTYVTLLAAFQILLHRHTGQEKILVGSPTTGRQSAKLRNVVGYFVNPVVLSSDFSSAPTFETFLAQVSQTVLAAFEHQEYPFALLVEQLQLERDPGRSPIFQVMFVFQKALLSEEESLASFALGEDGVKIHLGDLELESMALEGRDAQFDLTLAVAEKDGNIKASLEYNTDFFDRATVNLLAQHYQVLLESITTQPDLPVLSLNLFGESEKKQLIEEWNDTYADYSREVCLHQLIENQVERTPDAIAVVYEAQSLTYRELNSKANLLAHQLRQLGVGPEAVVAVLMERSVEMVVSLLAIHKAGGAYLPLDPTYPSERLTFIFENAGARVVLSQRRFEQILLGKEAQVLFVDEASEVMPGTNQQNIDSGVTAKNVACVIYTSGSTGEPKGVMNTHGGICNRLLWMQETYGLTATDSVLQKTPFTFDVSVWEFFWPLITGAHLVVARPEGHRDPAYLVDLIKAGQITTMHFVPSMLQSFLATPEVESCTSLKRVFSSGEALTRSIEQEFFKRVGCELHNLYGPTEAAVDVSFWACERFGKHEQVPIGKPIANTELYILNEELEPAPIGVNGEIYIGGAGLARGYVQRAGLTAEKFIPDPFSGRGARLYRTGDQGRYLADGNIEYRGRLDQQVKLRGYRIELGEIEAVLGQHEAVAQSVVNVWETESGDKRLVGYVVWERGQELAVEELRRYLSQRLPDYMVPGQCVVLNELPLTASGKVNRRALPAPEQSDFHGSEYVAPRTATEETLAKIWSEVLEVEQVGIHDNFFALGGHSLLVTQVISRIREAFSVDVPIQQFFYSPNIADLSIAITEQRAQKKDAAYINQILDNLEQISAADLDLLLQSQIASSSE